MYWILGGTPTRCQSSTRRRAVEDLGAHVGVEDKQGCPAINCLEVYDEGLSVRRLHLAII